MKEAVGVAREEWQEGVELENRKKVELALQEQQAVWDKKYAYYRLFHSANSKLSSNNSKSCDILNLNVY